MIRSIMLLNISKLDISIKHVSEYLPYIFPLVCLVHH